MFAVTAFYHRYFSHRTFRTSRPMQFLMGALACSTGQRGPLWWAAHHRHHHNHSDQQPDLHSPRVVGFLRAHMGWFMTTNAFATQRHYVRDWLRFPELRWLNRLDWAPLLLLAGGTWVAGAAMEAWAPQLGVSGGQLFTWGFLVSTVLLYHATYTINSLAHQFGSRRFRTGDDSRNNFLLALITLGEGWHNNHHHYPASARQGFYWWEIDLTWYGLLLLQRVGLIWDLRPVPDHVLQRDRLDGPEHSRVTRT
jgi:stearoyl-CoA desaturase (delta-9 desaturase)